MIINEMTQVEITELLEQASFGRLACVHDGQPYIVPLNFACHLGALYSFTTMGKKIDYMRANPKVCVEFDRVAAANDWRSVIVNGHYEELPKDSAHGDERLVAYELLSKRAEWWEPAYVNTVIGDQVRPLEPIYFRILITEKTGHKAIKTK